MEIQKGTPLCNKITEWWSKQKDSKLYGITIGRLFIGWIWCNNNKILWDHRTNALKVIDKNEVV